MPTAWASLLAVLLATNLLGPGPVAAQGPLESAQVRVLDGGSEPRMLLRYAWVPGTAETMLLTMDITAGTSVDGTRGMELVIPVTLRLALRIAEVDAEGSAEIAWRIDEAQVGAIAATIHGKTVAGDDMRLVSEEMDASVGALREATGNVSVDAHGHVLGGSVDPGDPLQQVLLAPVSSFIVPVEPLPDVPVGVGAVWTSTARGGGGGGDGGATVVTTSELSELAAGGLVLRQSYGTLADAPRRRGDGDGRPRRSRPDDPGEIAPGIVLLALDVRGTGEARIALDRIARQGRASLAMRLRLGVGERRERAQLDQDVVMEIGMQAEG